MLVYQESEELSEKRAIYRCFHETLDKRLIHANRKKNVKSGITLPSENMTKKERDAYVGKLSKSNINIFESVVKLEDLKTYSKDVQWKALTEWRKKFTISEIAFKSGVTEKLLVNYIVKLNSEIYKGDKGKAEAEMIEGRHNLPKELEYVVHVDILKKYSKDVQKLALEYWFKKYNKTKVAKEMGMYYSNLMDYGYELGALSRPSKAYRNKKKDELLGNSVCEDKSEVIPPVSNETCEVIPHVSNKKEEATKIAKEPQGINITESTFSCNIKDFVGSKEEIINYLNLISETMKLSKGEEFSLYISLSNI